MYFDLDFLSIDFSYKKMTIKLTSPSTSPSPKSQPQIQKGKWEFGLHTVIIIIIRFIISTINPGTGKVCW